MRELLEAVRAAADERHCLCCGAQTHCTNQLCPEHHSKHCTSGGIDGEGHDLKPSIFQSLLESPFYPAPR